MKNLTTIVLILSGVIGIYILTQPTPEYIYYVAIALFTMSVSIGVLQLIGDIRRR